MLRCIQKLLADGVSPTSVNTYLRGFKAYVRWLHQEGYLRELFRVQFLRTETKVLATFSTEHVRKLILYRPTLKTEKRSQAIALLILDTGLRIGETLGLRKDAVDFDNMLLQVRGKGNKVRKVPFSPECRKVLFKTCNRHDHGLVFCTRTARFC